jgi:hypothetical protein
MQEVEWFVVHGGVDSQLPRAGWRVFGSDGTGLVVGAANSRLHVVQGADQTWQVDSGTIC